MVDFAPAPTGNGYRMLNRRGGVFAWGDAVFYGSIGNLPSTPATAAVSIVTSASGSGYWIVRANGQVFSFGDAPYQGAPTAATLGTATVVAMDRTPVGNGYWITLSDGRVLPFGTAPSLGNASLPGPAVDFSPTPNGTGGYVADVDGNVDAIGTATVETDIAVPHDAVAVVSSPTGSGFWLATTGPLPGTIEGTVTDLAGQPLAGVCVAAVGPAYETATTDANGFYRIHPRYGQHAYRVAFAGCGNSSEYLMELWNDVPSYDQATPILPGYDQVTVANAGIAKASVISGVVTDEAGAPIAGACASAASTDTSGVAGGWGSATTTSTGYYRVGGLRQGEFSVHFRDCSAEGRYVPEHYDDADFPSLRTMVEVGVEDDVTGIDADLSEAARLTGVVRGPTGAPLGNVCVETHRAGGGEAEFAYSSSTGSYAVGGMRSGEYKALFRPCSPLLDVAYEWYENGHTFDDATTLELTEGEDVVVDVDLERAGSVSGVVTRQSTGAPLQGICVTPRGAPAPFPLSSTSSTGYYKINGLRPGDWNVEFNTCPFGDLPSKLATEWYPESPVEPAAPTVTVASGATTAGINGTLQVGGVISGVVTFAGSSTAGRSACVQVLGEGGRSLRSVWTSSTGFYRLTGIAPGPHRVEFGCAQQWGFADEFWNNADTFEAAMPVNAPATGLANINANLERAGSITGVVTDSRGLPAGGMCVQSDTDGYGYTSSPGFYQVNYLRPGSHKLEFRDCGSGFDGEWWQDAADEASATPIPVTGAATTSGIDPIVNLGVAAPASVEAVAGDGEALVSWTDPVFTPAREIVGWEVRALPHGPKVVAPPDAREAILPGLTNGTAYPIGVRAIFADGRGAARVADPIVPEGAPGSPHTCAKVGTDVLITLAPGDAVVVGRTPEGDFHVPGLGSSTNCGGARVDNVDSVHITGTAADEDVTIDLSNGLFGPGLTPEPLVSGASEIEIVVDLGDGAGDAVRVLGSTGQDTIRTSAAGASFGGDVELDGLVHAGVEHVRIEAGDGNDVLLLGAPSTVDGGAGSDLADYSAFGAGVVVDLFTGLAYLPATPYPIAGIENVTGSDFADTLRGSDGANLLIGRLGNDTIRARGGDDDVTGSGGNDSVAGGGGNDIVKGAAGDDSVLGDAGTDTCIDRVGTNSFTTCETVIVT